MLSFKKLHVYRAAIEFLTLTVKVSGDVPKGVAPLVDQLRRAAASTPLNIAEGAGRTSTADRARHYAIARGSAMECAAAFDALAALGVIDAKTHTQGEELIERIVSMLTKLGDFGSGAADGAQPR
jgi:four helix bundle protein